ncbi:MAG: MafI family immunity protein [Anaerolineae bacterium]|nr:MafI family immunity protein [Anaerolineae bacterium]
MTPPWLTREAILQALSEGWQPQKRGPAFEFGFDASTIRKIRARRIVEVCNRALEAVRVAISKQQYNDAHDYINKYGEWGLAMEFLIDWICEDDIRITERQFQYIQAAVKVMEMAAAERMKHLAWQIIVQE